MIAETRDAYYILYVVYHLRDYDTRLREAFFQSAHHDNDFEGAMLAVDKRTKAILAIETWFHSIFLQFTHTPYIFGEQTIDGKIHLEDATHPILYVQDKGHGVRGFQKVDEPLLAKDPHHIYRIGNKPTQLQGFEGTQIAYELHSFADFLRRARGPFYGDATRASLNAMFEAPADYGLGDSPIGRYVSGPFRGNSSWARPKPPWSWTDKFDYFRPGAWFFHPAHVFNRHFHFALSEEYIYNAGIDTLYPDARRSLATWIRGNSNDTFFRDRNPTWKDHLVSRLKQWTYHFIEFFFYHFG